MNDPADADEEFVPDIGVLLGLDFGTRRIGVALSDENQTIALPLETRERQSRDLDEAWLIRLARDYAARGVVVGLPVHMSGDEGDKAREARKFGCWVREVTGLPVVWWDERFSSAAADVVMSQMSLSSKKQKQRRDQLAAQVILQAFLDAEDRSQTPPAIDS